MLNSTEHEISTAHKNYIYAISTKVSSAGSNEIGDNCIQNFHLGRYIVGYRVGNLVLQ